MIGGKNKMVNDDGLRIIFNLKEKSDIGAKLYECLDSEEINRLFELLQNEN